MGCDVNYNDLLTGYDKIPVIRLLKEPAVNVEELWIRYPQGGEYGWEVLVSGKKYYWDIHTKSWEIVKGENLEDIIPIDKKELEVGDIPAWNGSEFGKMNINLFMTEEF